MKRTGLERKTPLRRTSALKSNGTKPKRQPISPASDGQRRKVLGKPCLVCRREPSEWLAIDPAHVVPRGLGGGDDPLDVVPLCRDFAGQGCHRSYDEGGLDLLPYLEPHYRAEQARAVELLGIAGAYRRLTNDRAVTA